MKILVIDDEKITLDSMASKLKTVFPKGEIFAFTKADKALEFAIDIYNENEALDYVFLEVELGVMSGIELAKKLKELFADLSVIFCTGHAKYAVDAYQMYAKGYLLKPVSSEDIIKVLDEMVKDWKKTSSELKRDIKVQTFGHFEVFIDGVPLKFEREKAKELFAYIVDRRGSSVTTEQIAAVLWEDEPYERRVKNRTTVVISSLKNTLKTAGVDDILIKSWNHLAVDVSKIKCDSYDFEKGDVVAVNSFSGEYMSNYSWAEFTLGKYVQIYEQKKGK